MSVPEGETFKLSPKNADELKIKLDRSKESVTVRVPYTSKPSQLTEAGYDHAGYWSYDKEAKQVVLEVRPNREYIIYK